MAGEASKGRMSSTNGGPAVTFEACQVTVNGPHCVPGEYNGVKATVAARCEKRTRRESVWRLALSRARSMSASKLEAWIWS